jgi:hypothetical protein
MDESRPLPRPFDAIVQEFTRLVDVYQKAQTPADKREALTAMRLVLEEADSLHKISRAQDLDKNKK